MGTTPRCPRHPNRLATDLCTRCTDFVCSECSSVSDAREVLCPECRSLPRMTAASVAVRPVSGPVFQPAAGPSWRAPVALVLGLFACTCFPVASVGAWLAIQALRQPAPQQPRTMAAVALVLNLAGLVWSVVQLARVAS